MTANGYPDLGGSGGESAPTTRDTRLVERAVRQRWPMSDALRGRAVAILQAVLDNKRSTIRNRLAAVRALAALDSQNLEQEKRDAGGEQVNVHVTLTVEQRRTELLGILSLLRDRAGAGADSIPPRRNGAPEAP